MDAWPGFIDLEVWRDERDETRFTMVSWWRTREDYVSYMRSAEHQRSHDRIPTDPAEPHALTVRQFRVVAR